MLTPNHFVFLACGSPFTGEQALLFFTAFISLLLGAVFTICNLIMVCVLYGRGQYVDGTSSAALPVWPWTS